VSRRRSHEISVAGRLGDLASAFAPHEVCSDGPVSLVRVRDVDQATLFGVIGLVEQLGLELLEVRLIEG
jgi:hypothetical protein